MQIKICSEVSVFIHLLLDHRSLLYQSISFIFMQLTKVDLYGNNLASLPGCLLELPKLTDFNLSCNEITHLPGIPNWSPSLVKMDLFSLPMNHAKASMLTSLNLSKNRFSQVPRYVCTFTTLTALDLSCNPNNRALPFEMCMLTKLEQLNVKGLKKLKEPPKVYHQSNPIQCIHYLQGKYNHHIDDLLSPAYDRWQ